MREYTLHGAPLAARDRRPKAKDTEKPQRPQNPRMASELGNKPGVKESVQMDTQEQEKARLIADGVQAWKKLTEKRVPDPTGTADATAAAHPPVARSSVGSNPSSAAEDSVHEHPKCTDTSFTTNSTGPKGDAEEGRKCPFASTFGSMPTAHPAIQRPDSRTQRPNSLPTNLEISVDPIQTPTASKRKSADLSSAPPSAAGSASKCPIRFLDHYSPEEVAQYFETHKHEIPRSHEVCVKRYQSNAESIRSLDAKYGSLVNMIQGLGAKHQPLLPAENEEAKSASLHGKSILKIEKWAEGVDYNPSTEALREPEEAPASNPQPKQGDSRQSHFQRPLRAVRVGESPSRPWGVSVPLPYRDDGNGDEDGSANIQPEADGRASQISLLQEKPTSRAGGAETRRCKRRSNDDKQPQMIFTGPVFIGYDPEQAAALLRQSGLGGGAEQS